MIRLVTVIGHGIELLPHFIEHYQKQVDEIQIVTYRSDMNRHIDDEVAEVIKDYENIRVVKDIYHRAYDWKKVTELYNEVKMSSPNEWWVVADIDEFQLYPNHNLKEMIFYCNQNGWDIVRGGFIDRVGEYGDFPEIKHDVDIFKQFPQAGFFRHPMSDACPNKICVMKGYVEVTPGQHYATFDGHTTWRWQGWNHPLIAPIDDFSVQVHHFKWDSTVLQRLQDVGSKSDEYAFSKEYRKMYNAIKDNNFRITIQNPKYMFETCPNSNFHSYRMWDKLIKKIISI